MKLRNKNGEGYIMPCVMILILCMIFSVLIYFSCVASMIRITRDNSETVFDSYITENAIDIYNSVKQGSDYTESLDTSEFLSEFCVFCSLERRGSVLYNYDSEGNLQYYLSMPTISFVQENTLKIRLTYTMYVPMYFNGARVGTATVPIDIKSSFMEKY